MIDKIYQEDVDAWVRENSETSAHFLFEEKMPGYSAKLGRLDKRIAKVLREIREVFPDAEFYTSGGNGFALVLGDTHEGKGDSQYQRVGWNGVCAKISGGDW